MKTFWLLAFVFVVLALLVKTNNDLTMPDGKNVAGEVGRYEARAAHWR